MSNKKKTWILEDHLCKKCGGRILRCATGYGMTPGGTSLYKCANCGLCAYGLSPDSLCWCGMKHRNQHIPAYMCLSFGEIENEPKLKEVFMRCGCDPENGEVGIVLVEDVRKLRIEG